MTAVVYHFTSTNELPLILASHTLAPNRDVFGFEDDDDRFIIFPSTVLLWATTKARGDCSVPTIVRSHYDEEWEWYKIHLVRFTLAAEDFEPWSKVITRCPEWSPEQIKYAKKYPTHRAWRCRAEPLPWERWLAIEIKSRNGRWESYDFRKHWKRDAVVLPGQPPDYFRSPRMQMYAEVIFDDAEARDRAIAELTERGLKVEPLDREDPLSSSYVWIKVCSTYYDGDDVDEFYAEMEDVVRHIEGEVIEKGCEPLFAEPDEFEVYSRALNTSKIKF